MGFSTNSTADGLKMLRIFEEFCKVLCGDGIKAAKAIISRDELECLQGDAALNGLCYLKSLIEKSQLLMTHSNRFRCFYYFVFFMCCERGQKNIAVGTSIKAWRLVFTGRFRLLEHWCDFVQKNQRFNISEDTWEQLLDFCRSVPENLEGYDLGAGAWPVLIDEFVNHMYRKSGQNIIHSSLLPGLNAKPGNKRRSSIGAETQIHTIKSEKPEEMSDQLSTKRARLWEGETWFHGPVLSSLH